MWLELPNILENYSTPAQMNWSFLSGMILLFLGWWFQTCFIVPYIGNKVNNWLSYFSDGLKPPTSFFVFFRWGYYKVLLSLQPTYGKSWPCSLVPKSFGTDWLFVVLRNRDTHWHPIGLSMIGFRIYFSENIIVLSHFLNKMTSFQ
jgi:hypothetical protein